MNVAADVYHLVIRPRRDNAAIFSVYYAQRNERNARRHEAMTNGPSVFPRLSPISQVPVLKRGLGKKEKFQE